VKRQELKEIIKKRIKEMSVSGDVGSYSTPFAFKGKKKLKEEELEITDPKIVERINQFTTIENQMNELLPLLQKAKQDTIEQYKQGSKEPIIYSTGLVIDYMNDLLKMFK